MPLAAVSYLTVSCEADSETGELKSAAVEYFSVDEIFGAKTVSAAGVVGDVAVLNADAASASANCCDVASAFKVCVVNGSAIFNLPCVV